MIQHAQPRVIRRGSFALNGDPVNGRPMRVALVTNFCPHYRRPLFQELGERMDLSLLLTSAGREWYWQGERSIETGGVRTAIVPGPVKIRRELRAGGYDAVIVGLSGRARLLAAVGSARSLDLPLVLWVGLWEHPRTLGHRLSHPMTRALYRSADAIVTYGSHVSDFIAREAKRRHGVFVAPQAVDNEFFRRDVPPRDVVALRQELQTGGNPVVAFVGRLEADKGVDVLLEASARLKLPHHVVIAGSGPRAGDLQVKANALGIGERVGFVGRVEQAQLPALLQASDLLVLPSISTKRWREPWGLVVNEAMNAGLPVIATDAVGAAAGGLVVNDRTGLIVPQRNAGALAFALESLLADQSKRERLGAAACAHVLNWNYRAAADAFESALAAAKAPRGRSCAS